VKAQQKKRLLKDIKKTKEKRIAKRIDFVLQTAGQSFQSIMIIFCVTHVI
jgi:hypothetical protein